MTAYRKHVIYVYKKLTGSRRLVDSLFSTVTLCPLGTGVCEDTTTDVVVEPGYDYSFSVYSYPTVTGGKVTVSTKHVSVEPTPSFTMMAVGGDSFITVTLADAKYPLSGACSFAVRDVFSFEQRMVYVTLPKGERKTVVASNLDMDTPYTVTCVLRDEMDMEGSKTIENVKTLPFVDPELELRKVADTAYDVQVEAVVNKPCELYCTVSPAGREWSLQELLTSGEQFSVTDSSAPFLVNLLLAQEPVEEYYVWCAAVVLSDHGVVRSVAITPSGLPFAPELIRTVPVNGATDVSARVNMELVFKYPVQVQSCQFCFFILYDTKELQVDQPVRVRVLGAAEPHRVQLRAAKLGDDVPAENVHARHDRGRFQQCSVRAQGRHVADVHVEEVPADRRRRDHRRRLLGSERRDPCHVQQLPLPERGSDHAERPLD